MEQKERLRKLLDDMPLDSDQKEFAWEAIDSISEEEAKRRADRLEAALERIRTLAASVR